MIEHDVEDIKTLFRGAEMSEVPVHRDLVGPAVAWGDTRRRRDRRLAVAATAGAMTVVVAVAVGVLRPDSGRGPAPVPAVGAAHGSPTHTASPTPAGAHPTGPPSSGSAPAKAPVGAALKQAQENWYRDVEALLPPGFHVTCDRSTFNPVNGVCSGAVDFISPTGSSMVQFTAPPMTPNPLSHEHVATDQIPEVSGIQHFPEGTVNVTSLDWEAQALMPANMLKTPSGLVSNLARYTFTPTDGGPSVQIQLNELFKDVPWASGYSGDGRKLFGYNPSGPVLTPQQFAKLAADPAFDALVRQWPSFGN